MIYFERRRIIAIFLQIASKIGKLSQPTNSNKKQPYYKYATKDCCIFQSSKKLKIKKFFAIFYYKNDHFAI